MLEIIILAAGKGTRMKSSKPKVLQNLAGKTLIQHVLDSAKKLNPEKIHIVIGSGAEQVRQALSSEVVIFHEQREQLGTGHAVAQVISSLADNSTCLILYGDVPLTSSGTLSKLADAASKTSIGLLTHYADDAHGYGRIVRNAEGQVARIVEQKDATSEQLKITEINTGLMSLHSSHLRQWLPQLSDDNAQGEYYLTDLVEMAVANEIAVSGSKCERLLEIQGVNDRRQLALLERLYQMRQADTFLELGLSLADPARFDCRGELVFGNDCFIDVNTVIIGQVTLGENVEVGSNCVLKNCEIGDNTVVLPNCMIDGAVISHEASIGPFARLRPGSRLANNTKIGNFVETKNAKIGSNSKVNHLSYVGDAILGERVNIGAGTITCNYDGVNKHQTVIKDDAFVGSNSALVAPVNIGSEATVGAGSTITSDVDDGCLSLTRSKQRQLNEWRRPLKK